MNIYDIAIARALSSGGGGGGNPNTVQTATGTLANPWESINISELATAIENKEATAYIDINASALGAGTISAKMSANTTSERLWVSGSNNTISSAYYIEWTTAGNIDEAKMLSGGNVVDISSYASVITTSLTVVWHPLPN